MINNGNTITEADLEVAFGDGYVSSLEENNHRVAGSTQITWDFINAYSSTDSELLSASFIPNDDFEVVAIGAYVATDGTPTVTVSLSGVLIEDISLTESLSASDSMARYNASGDKPLQVLLKGATYTISVSTDQSSGVSTIKPFIFYKCRNHNSY